MPIEETDIRKHNDAQDKLTAWVYTQVQRDDELRLDKVPAVVYYHGGVYVFGTRSGTYAAVWRRG